MAQYSLITLLLLWFMALPTQAMNLGTYGSTWEIEEPDMLETIQSRLMSMQENGEIDRLNQEWKQRSIATIMNPRPVPGIATASQSLKRLWDPSIEVQEDIVDPLGNVIVTAGTRLNPLDVVTLDRPLLFIDARDSRQIAFASKQLSDAPRTKVILTGGSWFDLAKSWKRQVYYDQGGFMTGRMGIRNVPALVKQSGKVLEIEEVADF